MSGDIVERLRDMHSDLRQGAYYTPTEDPTWDATLEAAAEIERLRGIDAYRMMAYSDALHCEIERLEAKVERLTSRGIEDMQAEIERLREALTEIERESDKQLMKRPYMTFPRIVRDIARRALEADR